MIQKLSELVFKVEKTYYYGLAPSPSKVLEEFPQESLTLSRLKKDFLRELKSLYPVFKIRFLNRSEDSLTLFFSSKKMKRSFSFKVYRPTNLSFDIFLNLIRPFLSLDSEISSIKKQAELKFKVMCHAILKGRDLIDDEFLATRNEIFHYIKDTSELVKYKLREIGYTVLDNYGVKVVSEKQGGVFWREIQMDIQYDYGSEPPLSVQIRVFAPDGLSHNIFLKLFTQREVKYYLKKEFNKKYRKTAELKFEVERIVNYDQRVFPFSILNDTTLSLTRREIPELIKKDRGEIWKIFGINPVNSFYYSLSNVETDYDYSSFSQLIKFAIEFKYKSKKHDNQEFPITLYYDIKAPKGVPMDKLLPKKFLSPPI